MASKMFFKAVVGTLRRDVVKLADTLGVEIQTEGQLTRSEARALWEALSYSGSNDFAYAMRGFRGIDYPEIVRDVCKQKKIRNIAEGDSDGAVLHNENALLEQVLSDVLQMLSETELRELLRGANIDEAELRSKGVAAFLGILAAQSGGFVTYQAAVIIANLLARAAIGRGLTFGANAALTRGLGVALGPVGMAVGGVFALNDLAAPATRITLPAVLYVAILRRMGQPAGSVSSRRGRPRELAAKRMRVRRAHRKRGPQANPAGTDSR